MLAEKTKILIITLLVLASIFPFVVMAGGIISDDTIVPQAWNSFSPPSGLGSSYTDPAFGTKVYRMTNSSNFSDNAIGGYFANGEICYFNTDGSFFIAEAPEVVDGVEMNCTFLYNAHSGARIKMLGARGWGAYWIRWALANKYQKNGQYVEIDPVYHFYMMTENEIRLYDVRDVDNFVVIHKFTEYLSIGPAGGEGDLSDDGRYWVVDGDDTTMFAYDLIDDIKHPASTFDVGSMGSKGSAVGVDYACISPRGNYIVVAWGTDPGIGRYRGIEVYNLDWTFQRQIYPGIIHWEIGVDAFNEEVVYTAGSAQYADFSELQGITTGDFISIRLRDGKIRLLQYVPIWSHFSMSACNTARDGKYIYVSLTSNRTTDPYSEWGPYWGEIIEIPTDGSGETRRLVHHRSRLVAGKSEKYATPDAVVNRQGTKIVFRSTYNSAYGDLFWFDITPREVSTTDIIPPNAPESLNAPYAEANSITLEWQVPETASDGDVAAYYKIYRNSEFLAEVFETRYTDSGLGESTSYAYEVFAFDDANNQSENSTSGTFSTTGDTTPPELENFAIQNQETIRLVFDKPVEKTSAENIENYFLNNNAQVLSAKLSEDGVTVDLTISPIALGKDYEFTAQNVTDNTVTKNSMSLTIRLFSLLKDFYEDFENFDADNWTYLDQTRWNVDQETVDNNALFLNSSDYDSPGGKMLGEIALIKSEKFIAQDFKLSCSIKTTEDLLANDQADYAIIYNYQDSQNYDYIQFHTYDISVNRVINGDRSYQEKFETSVDFDEFVKIDVQLADDMLSVSINNNLIYTFAITVDDPGQIGFGAYNDAALFDNINLEGNLKSDTTPPAAPGGFKMSAN